MTELMYAKMINSKYNKLVNIIKKKKQAYGYREQTRGYQWWGGNTGVGGLEVQTIGGEIGYKDVLLCNMRISPTFCNNCKWRESPLTIV